MSIEALVDPAPGTLRAAAARADVASAMEEAHASLADLRFSEGLRRGRQEARGPSSDPASALARGIWRSQWNLASRFPPLNTRSSAGPRTPSVPLPSLIAGLHRDACSALVAAGLVPTSSVAVPTDPSLLAPALAYARCDAPALAVAAALSAHFRFRRVFEPASCAVGAGVARWILVTRGVDPTGVCVPGAYDAVDPARAGRALAGWVSADEAGLARWITHYCAGVVYGARVGRDVARHVQAGRLA